MDELIKGEFVADALEAFGNSQLFRFMFPELSVQVGYNQKTPWHDFDLFTHTRKVVQIARDDGADLDMLWACLFHDIAKPFVAVKKKDREQFNYPKHDLLGAEMVRKQALYLKWSSSRTDNVIELVRNHLLEDSLMKPYDSGAQKLEEE
jgi:tRNA nucleotidyltransferase (CCA-adding enzyme)